MSVGVIARFEFTEGNDEAIERSSREQADLFRRPPTFEPVDIVAARQPGP